MWFSNAQGPIALAVSRCTRVTINQACQQKLADCSYLLTLARALAGLFAAVRCDRHEVFWWVFVLFGCTSCAFALCPLGFCRVRRAGAIFGPWGRPFALCCGQFGLCRVLPGFFGQPRLLNGVGSSGVALDRGVGLLFLVLGACVLNIHQCGVCTRLLAIGIAASVYRVLAASPRRY